MYPVDCDVDVSVIEVSRQYDFESFTHFFRDVFNPVRSQETIGFALKLQTHVARVHDTFRYDMMFVELYCPLI
ncbi:MAG: hypothetical protein ACI4AK_09450 [Lepagella sp.]